MLPGTGDTDGCPSLGGGSGDTIPLQPKPPAVRVEGVKANRLFWEASPNRGCVLGHFQRIRFENDVVSVNLHHRFVPLPRSRGFHTNF